MTLATPSGPAVSNTSCLIALEVIGRLDLLADQYRSLLIPPAVAHEWGVPTPPWITVLGVQNQTAVQVLRLHLGHGEAEAIVLSLEVAAQRLILDDQRARNIAASLGVQVTGTLGIVLRAKQVGLIPLVRPLLEDLDQAGFWLSPSLVQQALHIAGE